MARKMILVVDDEPEFIDMVTMRLEACGYDIVSAHNGQSAVERARKERPHLILMDLVMPDSNGFEALSNLKLDGFTANIPVIMITAKCDTDYILDAGKLGACEYLTKPVSMQTLEEMVRKHI